MSMDAENGPEQIFTTVWEMLAWKKKTKHSTLLYKEMFFKTLKIKLYILYIINKMGIYLLMKSDV